MTPLYMEYYEKRILIRHPLKENHSYLEYMLNDLAEEKTIKILEEFGFNQWCADFEQGMTNVFVELMFPYNTPDETIEKICNKIIKSLHYKKYVWKDPIY